MGLRPIQALARQFDDAGFDDDATAAVRGILVARREDSTNAGAAPDLAAVEFGIAGVPHPTAGQRNGLQDTVQIFAAPLAALRADLAKFRLEIIVLGRHHRCLHHL